MFDVLVRAGCFVAIIVAGYLLRKFGFFKEGDFNILSKIVLKITLPAAFISNFAGKEIDPSLLFVALLAFGMGVLYMVIGYLINIKKGKDEQAFGLLNLPGYNIGNFTLPFVQNFVGPLGVITTSIFDVGNAFVCLGGAYGVAASIKGEGKFSFKRILKALSRSVAFLTCFTMVTLGLLKISLPSPIVSLAGIVGGANSFLAMLMIGVGFKLSGDKSQIGTIVKMLSIRYGLAFVFAGLVYYFLPLEPEAKLAVMILAFSPIGSAVPGFTAEIKGNVGLSSALNSISIICSIVLIVSLLLVMA